VSDGETKKPTVGTPFPRTTKHFAERISDSSHQQLEAGKLGCIVLLAFFLPLFCPANFLFDLSTFFLIYQLSF
jgi:hypothetical protein